MKVRLMSVPDSVGRKNREEKVSSVSRELPVKVCGLKPELPYAEDRLFAAGAGH